MESKIITKFKGEINGVEFDDAQIYQTADYLLEQMEGKFGKIPQEFIKDLRDTIDRVRDKYEDFNMATFERSVSESIDLSKSVKELLINYDGETWKMEDINKKLMRNQYNFDVPENKWEKKIKESKSKGIER